MFDRFKAGEQEQYLFLQLPIMLIKDNKFKELSSDAKILYSLLLNRTSLSAKNGWIDDNGDIYIIYTIEQIMEDLNCWEKRATKAMKELKDIGLVESIRRGLGKPNILYVTNFATELKYQKPYETKNEKKHEKTPVESLNCQNDNSRLVETTNQELSKEQFKTCQNDNVVILTNSNTNFRNIESKSESKSAKPEKVIHKNDDYDNELLNTSNKNNKGKEPPVSTAAQSTETKSPLSKSPTNSGTSEYDYNTYRLILQENIDYLHYATYNRTDIDLIYELIECMLDVICTPGDTVKIGKENKPRQMVISQYLKINSMDIDHVIERYKEQHHKITHLHAYLKTMLYTVKQEQGHYYTNAVRADGAVW